MAESKYFTYKGFPLVRKGKELYYGSMSNDTIARLQILSSHKVNELEVADKIRVQLSLTAPDVDASKMIVKNCERGGLYEALDVAYVWLTRS